MNEGPSAGSEPGAAGAPLPAGARRGRRVALALAVGLGVVALGTCACSLLGSRSLPPVYERAAPAGAPALAEVRCTWFEDDGRAEVTLLLELPDGADPEDAEVHLGETLLRFDGESFSEAGYGLRQPEGGRLRVDLDLSDWGEPARPERLDELSAQVDVAVFGARVRGRVADGASQLGGRREVPEGAGVVVEPVAWSPERVVVRVQAEFPERVSLAVVGPEGEGLGYVSRATLVASDVGEWTFEFDGDPRCPAGAGLDVAYLTSLTRYSGQVRASDVPVQPYRPGPEDVTLRGRTLREWFEAFASERDPIEAESMAFMLADCEAARVLVPRFLAVFEDEQAPVRRRISALSLVIELGLGGPDEASTVAAVLRQLRSDDGDLVRAICAQILNVGPTFVDAAPLLLERVEREGDAGRLTFGRWAGGDYRAAMGAVCASPRALPYVTEAYGSEQELVRAMAVEGMAHLDALPLLQRALRDPSERVRDVALRRLGLFAGHGEAVFPILFDLVHGDSDLAPGAITALASYEDEVAPRLLEVCLDRARPLAERLRFMRVFEQMKWPHRTFTVTRRCLGQILEQGEVELRRAAAPCLFRCAEDTEAGGLDAVRILLPHRQDEDGEVRQRVAEALRALGREIPETREVLERAGVE